MGIGGERTGTAMPMRRRSSGAGLVHFGTLIAITALAVLLSAASASGAPFAFESTFGSYGTGTHQFAGPRGVAFDAQGDLWVADRFNHRVVKFRPDGEFLLMLGRGVDKTTGANICTAESGHICGEGVIGTASGAFSYPSYVSVGQGHVWVTEEGNGRVQEFTESGEFIRKFGTNGGEGELEPEEIACGKGNGEFCVPEGIATDSSGNVWVADSENGRIEKFSPEGKYLSAIGGLEPWGVAVDASNNIWVTDYSAGAGLKEFNANGELVASGSPPPNGEEPWRRFGVAIDPEGNVWVVGSDILRPINEEETSWPDGTPLWEFNSEAKFLRKFGSFGVGTGEFFPLDPPEGLAFDFEGNIWVGDSGNDRINKFRTLAPHATTGSATEVGASGATLNGKVNPEGNATKYYFEYGTTTAYGAKAPASPKEAGSGTGDVAVSESVSGLAANTTYHFRLVASSEAGTRKGSDATLTTAAAFAPACPNKTLNLQGKGASLQRVAQQEWTGREVPSGEPLVEIPHKLLEPVRGYAKACPEGPTMSYTSTGSGPGLKAFRYTGAGAIENSLAFVGSDDAPTAAQIENAQKAGEAGLHAIIIPVIQTSIAVPVHLPEGCVINGGITWKDLTKLFAGTITEWIGLETDNGAEACKAKITRVVRSEGSGTTYQFKNYLSVLETTAGIAAVGPGCGLGTWAGLREIGAEEKPNITWPECEGTSPVERKAGGGAVAEFVAKEVNTIGYAALPDAKAKGATTAALQNGEPEGSKTYANPYKAAPSEEANCGSRVYTVPLGGRKGEAAESIDWSGVFGAKPKVGSAYPLCTLTYDLGWNTYKLAKYGAESEKIGENVKDYILNYVLGKEEGQKVGHWYAPLPETEKAENNVLGAAVTAAEKLK